jgi:virulence-associated protein VagC
MNESDKSEAARLMKNLDIDTRNMLIEESDNVIDIRPELKHKLKQRQLQEKYKKSFTRKPVK